MLPSTPADVNWTSTVLLVGALAAAVLSLVALCRTPIRNGVQWVVLWGIRAQKGAVAESVAQGFTDPQRREDAAVLVIGALEHAPTRHRKLLDDRLGSELRAIRDADERLDNTERKVSTLESAVTTLAETAKAVPELSATMREVRHTLTTLNDTVKTFDKSLREHGQDVAHMRGAFEQWDGQERRRRERRDAGGA